MDRFERNQFLRDRNKRVFPSKRIPKECNFFDNLDTGTPFDSELEFNYDLDSSYQPFESMAQSVVKQKEQVSLHSSIRANLKSKDFWDDYVQRFFRRTLIAVTLLFVFQIWSLSKIKFGNISVNQVKDAISTHYTWNSVNELFENIDYDRIVEVWNEQGKK